jgi:hypothetical protein
METNGSDRQHGQRSPVYIERWTVERLDRDVDLARIESVPMRSEFITAEFANALIKTGVEPGMDRLSHWDLDRARIRRMSRKRLAGELGLRPNEIEALSENMVFWILGDDPDKPPRVIHATRAARETAKDLYREATRREEGRS